MSMNEDELRTELDRIKNNAFDIKGYFEPLFAQLLPDELLHQDDVAVVNQLVDEDSLAEQLAKRYDSEKYVVMLYAHKPHSPAVSPEFPKEPRAHTSVLLGKVHEGRIQQVLNIDGYHFPGYVDILGERPGGTPNPYIKQRLVVRADGEHSKTPLQRASWYNMNCVLYSFTFVERLLELFNTQQELMETIFPENPQERVSPESLFLLEESILEGMVGKYVRREGPNFRYDDACRNEHHNQIRNTLAQTVEASYRERMKSTRSEEEITQPQKPLEQQRTTVQPQQSSTPYQGNTNYSFLLKAGAALCATASIGALVVTVLALAAILSIPGVGVGAIAAVGLAAGAASFGLFKTAKKNEDKQPLTNTIPLTNS